MNDNYIKLPRGKFFMGTDDENAREREKPRHEVSIDYDIAMAKHCVTVEDYMLYSQATGVEIPEEKLEHLGVDVPLRRVRWTEAVAYASGSLSVKGRPIDCLLRQSGSMLVGQGHRRGFVLGMM